MKNIVNIQITPVKNILVNPLSSIIEPFNPNDYTEKQVEKIKKKGYLESSITDDNQSSDLTNNSLTSGTTTSGTTTSSTTTSGTMNSNNKISSNLSSSNTKMNQNIMQGNIMGWNAEQKKKFLNDLVQTRNKAVNENPRTLNLMDDLINDLSVIDNKNFTGAVDSRDNAKAMNEKLLDAQRKFNSLVGSVDNSNKNTIKQLKAEYESRIRKWTEDYEKSINYYKEYIKNQEKWMKELEQQNLTLTDAMQRNTEKLNSLAKKWDEAQNKINNFEKELLQSNSKKYDEIIRSLKQQLAAEKVKQSSIDDKIAQLRAEKAQLDALFAENVEKLKQAGLGKHCPKDFNMNDYIHKKKIPCWGCIL